MKVGDLVWIKQKRKMGIVCKYSKGEYWIKQPDCSGYYVCRGYQLDFIDKK